METLSSPSVTVVRHLRACVARWNEDEHRCNASRVPSLASLASDATLGILEEEGDNIHVATAQLAKDVDFVVLRHVLDNPKATYPSLRAFHDLKLSSGRNAIDLDDAVIRHERFLLRRPNEDGKYLISLEDFVRMLPNKIFSKPYVVSFVRKDPPKGGELRLICSNDLSSNPASGAIVFN